MKKRTKKSKRVNKKKKNCGKDRVLLKNVGDLSPLPGNTSADLPDDMKMSEILLTLAEPLLQKYGKNFERVKGILTFAMTAWNLSMLPEPTEEKIATEITNTLPEEFSAEEVAAMLHAVYTLMNRKRKLFQDIQRVITKIDLRESATKLDLTVFSVPIQATGESLADTVADCSNAS
jgi:hypothetical protein